MSLASNSIDVHEFIALKGDIIPPAQVKVIIDRPGVDSHEFKTLGNKGEPFQLTSYVDCEDLADAKYWLTVYQRLQAEGAVEIVQGGVSGDDDGFRVNVVRVVGSPMTIAGGVGYSFSTNKQGFLIAQWTLVAVPFET